MLTNELKIRVTPDNTILIEGTELLRPITVIQDLVIGDNRHFIQSTNVEGIYTYGIEDLRTGYVYSSRCGVMNKRFDTCLIEAGYKRKKDICYRACAIDLVRFEEALNKQGYEVNFTPIENTEHDVVYSVKKKENK